jgi:leucyl-tRNA synthetase
VELAVQVNGKVRARINVDPDAVEDVVKAQALEAVRDPINGKKVVSIRVVPGRLVSVVIQ